MFTKWLLHIMKSDKRYSQKIFLFRVTLSPIIGTDVRELNLKRDAMWYGERISVHVEPTI